MPSPFPGMDPYLEQATVWHDFHESMIYECRRLLVPQISPAYVAKLDEHIYVHELAADERRFIGRGDVTGASFGFVPGDDEWSTAPDGKQVRTHTSVRKLLDVSPVTWPAYEGATVALRHLEIHGPSAREQAIRSRHARLVEGRQQCR